MRYNFTPQLDARDCGSACLHMVSRHHGRQHNLALLREYFHITREDVSLLGISDAAEKIGFHSMGVKISFDKLANEVPLPCMAENITSQFISILNSIAMPYKQADQEICSIKKETPGKE